MPAPSPGNAIVSTNLNPREVEHTREEGRNFRSVAGHVILGSITSTYSHRSWFRLQQPI